MMKKILFLFFAFSSFAYAGDVKNITMQKASLFSYSLPRCHLGYHWINNFKYAQDNVELEDGSIWIVDPSEKHHILRWSRNDPIAIIQNSSWFSRYDFLLINLVSNDVVGINPSFGPILKGDYTHWVTGVDAKNGYILLEDNTSWKINSSDLSLLKKWLLEDTVIIGTNYSWSGEDYILINVNLDYQVVRANAI